MTSNITRDNRVTTISADDPDYLMTIEEAAPILQVSTKTLDRWTKAGYVQVYVLPSGHRRYKRVDLEGLIKVVPAKTQAKNEQVDQEEQQA